MSDKTVLTKIDSFGVGTVILNRPRVNNAYNSEMIKGLLDAFGSMLSNEAVRVIVLRGNGNHFQAGADLKWIAKVASYSIEENIEISRETTDAIRILNKSLKPTIALVHGGCFGGGTGLVAACDIVIASLEAVFSISEVRWGLHAGPILPQLVAKIGSTNLRRFALTGERFSAEKAKSMGLVDEVCEEGGLADAMNPIINSIMQNGPQAISDTKRLILEASRLTIDDNFAEHLAVEHALKRRSQEASEGLLSFLEKREALWFKGK